MNRIKILAMKEIRDGTRNRWVILTTLLMAGLALVLAMLGSTPTGTTRISSLAVSIVSLSSLSIFFIPLIALLLSYDSIVGEGERGTLILLLAHPVARWQIVVGKFLGFLVLLSFATITGFGSAGVLLAFTSDTPFSEQAWIGFITLLLSSVLLGAVFLAIGLLISTLVRERGAAGGVAVGIWLLFVLVYDMGLLALLSADGGTMMSENLVTGLLLANPTDTYRMLNLTGNAEVALLSGMASISSAGKVSLTILSTLLLAWVVMPLGLACIAFQKKAI